MRTPVLLAALATLALAGVAAPAASGGPYGVVAEATRTLSLTGTVESKLMRGTRVAVVFRNHGVCKQATWRVDGPVGQAADIRPTDCPDQATRGTRATKIWRGGLMLELRPGAVDRPDRLRVWSGGRLVRDWPLVERASGLDASDGIAVYTTERGKGLYAIRLADGKQALIALNRRSDTAQLEMSGAVFQDNLIKRQARGTIALRFLPRAAIEAALERVGAPLRTSSPITAFAADGPRVAFAVRDAGIGCNRVMYWNVPWHHVARLTMPAGPSCPEGGTPASIDRLALGGVRAAWTMTTPRTTTVLASTIVTCVERFASRQRPNNGAALLAGDGNVLAFARVAGSSGPVMSMGRDLFGVPIGRNVGTVDISADNGRIAALGRDGRIEVLGAQGRSVSTVVSPTARALALRGPRLVVLRPGAIDVFNAKNAKLLHTWRIPAGADARLDAHFGVAVFTSGQTVHALRLSDGKTVAVARTSTPPVAQIDAAGIVIRTNADGRGVLQVVPTSAVERLF